MSIGHQHLIEQAAWVVAQVDDVALELVADLGREIADRLLQILGGLLVELGDADKATSSPSSRERRPRDARAAPARSSSAAMARRKRCTEPRTRPCYRT
jgi:hypothetical protein